MCGISLISGSNLNLQKSIDLLLKEIQHRGPDNQESIIHDNVAIGSTRLSIFDLSSSGNMPMADKSNRYLISYNGEIYNFLELKEKFNIQTKSNSDTEVLIELYSKIGDEVLKYLNGIFAFIIYDKLEKKLFVARDRLGVKPVFFYKKEDCFIISSEIKSILKLIGKNIEFNYENISTYLETSFYDYGKTTFYKNVYQLKQGHYFEYDIINKNFFFKRYWNLNSIKSNHDTKPFNSLSKKLNYLLENSFKIQTRTDTDIGANISSGIDSKLMVTYLEKSRDKKISYNSYFFEDKQYSEKENVEQFAKEKKINVNYFKITPKDIINNFDNVLEYQNEPFPGVPTIAKHLLIKRAYENKCKVILEAQGGDDFAGGYKYIFPYFIKDLLNRKNFFNAAHEIKCFCKIENMSLLHFYKFYMDINHSFKRGGTSADGTKSLRNNYFLKNFQYPKELMHNLDLIEDSFSNLKKILYRDIFYCKLPRILRSCDRASMANSKELRVPLLDHNIVEFFFDLENSQFIKKGNLRYFYRIFCQNYLGIKDSFLTKKYVSDPQTTWLKNDLFDWAYERLINSKNLFHLFYKKKEFANYLINFRKSKINNSNAIWQALCIQKLLDN